MSKDNPVEETEIVRREVGYTWFYSLERGAPNDRQHASVGGNEALLQTCLTQLRKAKVEITRLLEAGAEQLQDPPPFRGFLAAEKAKEKLH